MNHEKFQEETHQQKNKEDHYKISRN